MVINGIEVGVKIRFMFEELKEFELWLILNFKEGWELYFKNKFDKFVMYYLVIVGWFGDYMLVFFGNYFIMLVIILFLELYSFMSLV